MHLGHKVAQLATERRRSVSTQHGVAGWHWPACCASRGGGGRSDKMQDLPGTDGGRPVEFAPATWKREVPGGRICGSKHIGIECQMNVRSSLS